MAIEWLFGKLDAVIVTALIAGAVSITGVDD